MEILSSHVEEEPIKELKWQDVIHDVWYYYNKAPDCYNNMQEGNGAGGCLHIVLDDGNISDSSVSFCVDDAIRCQDLLGERLARKLLLLSWRQRARLYFNYNLYAYGTEKPE
jgi:hypothetical protein